MTPSELHSTDSTDINQSLYATQLEPDADLALLSCDIENENKNFKANSVFRC